MKVSKRKYERIDALSKIIGLILLAVSVDSLTRGNYYTALALFGLGGMVGIIPMFIEVET